jgi:hypothetical protein
MTHAHQYSRLFRGTDTPACALGISLSAHLSHHPEGAPSLAPLSHAKGGSLPSNATNPLLFTPIGVLP